MARRPRELVWVGAVEAVGLALALAGWFLGKPGILWAGVAVMLVSTLAFAPLLALARLQVRTSRAAIDQEK